MATFRHSVKLPSVKTINSPSVADIPAIAVITPRTDGSLSNHFKNSYVNAFFYEHFYLVEVFVIAHHISPTYVTIGASIKPTPKPNKA